MGGDFMGLKKVGVLWKKDSKQNKEYLTGTLDMGALGESRIMVFQNDKKKDNQPDYSISLVLEDEEETKK
jgi:uncharacterized protein (DUF736 family)